MEAGWFKAWLAIRSSYWFVPSMMAFGAILLGAVMVWVDVLTGSGWLSGHIGWYQSVKPAGARDVLSTIAGSTLTVAATAFSVTIAAISFASGQFGPRLLTNFMGDRGNTITLGTFVATYVYCLFVLRTIREGQDGGFVPQLAVLVGIILGLCSIGVLIYFIHHVPRSIHINHVIEGIGKQLIRGIDRQFPKSFGEPATEPEARPESPTVPKLPQGQTRAVPAPRAGYIQSIEEGPLLKTAAKHDLVLRLRYRPGDFVAKGRPLLDAWPSDATSAEACRSLAGAFAIGGERTPYGDLHFLIKELVEIAGRSLSSGVNDPMTAVTCIDWMGAALGEISNRVLPDPYRVDESGTIRLIALPAEFATFVSSGFGQLRQYVSRDAIAARHMLKTIGIVAARCRTESQLQALEEERRKLSELARDKLTGASLQSVERWSLELEELLSLGPGQIDEREADWLGGSA